MTRDELIKAVEKAKMETKTALELVYNTLNQGQQKKLVKDEHVRALFDTCGVEYDN